ncbi:MAG: PilZ domain-containing protein [Acidobacteria bacterium]|nr:PilZ domain-containing protein [Acidobacteriota bacterium]
MSRSHELRASERIPTSAQVRVVGKGRKVILAVAINFSLGGILLHATPPLPVGSTCEVVILSGSGPEGTLRAEGTVIRGDGAGSVVKFASPLPSTAYSVLSMDANQGMFSSLIKSYRDYFQVSRSPILEGCEELLGVTKSQFRNVFYTTFSASIPIAVVPVWIFRESLQIGPNWARIVAAFAYGALWFLLLQPTLDILTLRRLRARNTSPAGPGS